MKTIYLQTIDGAVKALGGADSAVLRPGEPVFVPEPVEDWCSFVALAIRISRLGMNIKPSFARQSYHELGAVHVLLPRRPGPIPPLFCDRAIAPGKWLDLDMVVSGSLDVCITDDSDAKLTMLSMPLEIDCLGIDRAVNMVSRYMTLKTGDMIIFGDSAVEVGTPRLDTRLTASISSQPSLDIRFK